MNSSKEEKSKAIFSTLILYLISRSDFKIVMEGRATNGGYAVDQLVFSPGKCSSKIRVYIYT